MMRLSATLFATIVIFAAGASSSLAADRYFDLNNDTAGSGVTAGSTSTWNTTNLLWNDVEPGTNPTIAWADNDAAIFSAAADGNVAFTVNPATGTLASSVKVEEGTLTIGGTGFVNVGAGTITVESGAILATNSSARVAATAGAQYILNGGTLRTTNGASAGSFVDVDAVIVLNGGGTVDYNVTGFLNIIQTTTIISGTGPLTKSGAGALALASPSTYTGATIINDGELRLRSTTNRLPTTTDVTINSPGILNVNGSAQNQTIASLSGNGRVGLGNATLTVNGTTSTTFSGTVEDIANVSTPAAPATTSTGGNLTKNGASMLTLTGANTFTGTLTIGSQVGNSVSIGSGGTTGSVTSNIATTTNGALIFNRSDAISYAGVISGAGTVTKLGADTLTFNNTWTNTGGLIVNAGTVLYGSPAGLADTVPVTINDTGTLDMASTTDTFGSLVSATGNNLGQLLMGTANLTLGQTATTGRTYSGKISGSGTLTKAGGTFLQTLSGDNSLFTGPIVVSMGRLSVGHASALGDTAANTQVETGTNVLFTGATTNFTINEPFRIAGPGGSDNGAIAVTNDANPNIAGPVTLFGDTILTVSGAASATYSNAAAITAESNQNLTLQGGAPSTGTGGSITGVINLGTGSLTKLQGGTWALSGNNLYSGGTTISAGRLLANNSAGSATGSGMVTVSGGTLGGTGTVAGPVVVNTDGHIAPGASIGTLNLGGALTLETGSVLDFELGAPTTGDLLNVAGLLTLNGGSVNVLDAGGMAAGTYTVIDYATLAGSIAALGTPTGPAGFTYNLIDTGSVINLQVIAATAALLGDFNQDNFVDAADYVIWRENDAANNPLPNDDGVLTQDLRYGVWRSHFGNTLPGSGAALSQGVPAVPEPSTLLLLVAAAGLLAAGRRSR